MAVNNSAPIERCHESRILVIPKNGIRLETSPGDPYIFAKDWWVSRGVHKNPLDHTRKNLGVSYFRVNV